MEQSSAVNRPLTTCTTTSIKFAALMYLVAGFFGLTLKSWTHKVETRAFIYKPLSMNCGRDLSSKVLPGNKLKHYRREAAGRAEVSRALKLLL